MKQATGLVCTKEVAFKVNGKGRTIVFKVGQEFWVTNTEVDQNNRQCVNVARKGQKFGYDCTPEQVSTYFVVQ